MTTRTQTHHPTQQRNPQPRHVSRNIPKSSPIQPRNLCALLQSAVPATQINVHPQSTASQTRPWPPIDLTYERKPFEVPSTRQESLRFGSWGTFRLLRTACFLGLWHSANMSNGHYSASFVERKPTLDAIRTLPKTLRNCEELGLTHHEFSIIRRQ